MVKYWAILGIVTAVATIIVIVPFLPQHALAPIAPIVEALVPKDTSIKVLFVGDIMLDRSVAVHAREVGDEALFKGVEQLFGGHDLLIGNLEGTLTTQPSIAQQNNSILRFTFDPHYANLLASLGFSAVSLANNHALDFGKSGYDETRSYLDTVQIGSFGAPYNDAHLALKINVKDKILCMVGYHSLYKSDYSMIIEKIKNVRLLCNYVVVMAHWGEEYKLEPIAQQQEAAHAFIDAGADLIIGSHPHVVEPLEVYNNHAIFYSLGNFLFDQGFSPQVMRGLAVEVTFDTEKTRFVLTPVNTYKEVSVAIDPTADAVLKDVGIVGNAFELVK